jgi:drug/metabolite transporter (DMT)-like permease
MTTLAIALVLGSALLHAWWNLLAKNASGSTAFSWLFSVLSTLMFAPAVAAVVLIERPQIGTPQIVFLVGTALIHSLYFSLLEQGYRVGDLSLVYPLARGSGPLLSTGLAILLLGERPSLAALAGALLITISIFFLTGDPRKLRQSGAGRAVIFALLTGVTIAAYTLWDKHAVSILLIPPLMQDWASAGGRSLFLLPYALSHRSDIRREWQIHRREAFGVAVLSPISYILLLTALAFSPVSYVAPFRQVSILIGALLGARMLSEADSRRRLISAGVMMIGVAALALG